MEERWDRLGGLLTVAFLLTPGVAIADELDLDVIGRHNPPGIAMFATWGMRRPAGAGPEEPYSRAALRAGVTPAYGQVGAIGDWVPYPALQLKAAYDILRYFGASDGLLSFPARDAPFGDRARDALSGREEAALAHRLMLQPAVRLKTGAWRFQNQTDIAHYWMGGRGPYLLELEYDTLLEERDWLVANRTTALRDLAAGGSRGSLAAGPLFEFVRARGSGLERRRIALALRWNAERSYGLIENPRVLVLLGINLVDPNRRGQPFLLATVGARLGQPRR